MKLSIDVGDNITRLLEKLAAQIGVTADKIFPWYVKQAIIEGYAGIIIWAVMTTIFTVLFGVLFKKSGGGRNGESHLSVLLIVGIVLLLCIAYTPLLSAWISKILNPEYAATTRLLAQIARLEPKTR
ncbi:MAG: hypothetical protein WC428_06360 [Candidatus Paceibacterota bacterium]